MALFHAIVKMPEYKDMLNISHNGYDKQSAQFIAKTERMPSVSVSLFLSRDLIFLSTSSTDRAILHNTLDDSYTFEY